MLIPKNATHAAETYGKIEYYQQVNYKHLNQVAEEWQTLTRWNNWVKGVWVDVGEGFSSRRLQRIK